MLNYLFTQTPLAFFVQSLWRDEAFSYLMGQRSVWEIITLTARDFAPPLYYLVLHFWMKGAGGSEIALRSLSLLFFVSTVYVVYLFVTQIFTITAKRAFIYTLFFAANPLILYYAFEARMYAMMSFLAIVSFYFFVKGNYKVYFLSTLAGVFTHYFMVFVPIAQGLYLLFFRLKGPQTKNLLAAIGLVFGFFTPWFLFFLSSNQSTTDSFWITRIPTLTTLPAILYVGFDENMRYVRNVLKPLSAVLTLVLFVGFFKSIRQPADDKKLLPLLMMWILVPTISVFLLSFFKPLFLGRYLIFGTVGFLLLLIYLIDKLEFHTRIVVLAVLLLFSVSIWNKQLQFQKKADSRQVFGEIKKIADTNDFVYVTSVLSFHEAQYYFDMERVFIYDKSYDEIPRFVGKVLIPENRLTRKLPIFPRKAFVVHEDLSYEVQSLY